MMKLLFMLTICLLSYFGCASQTHKTVQPNNQSNKSSSADLDSLCSSGSGCCKASLETIKENSYVVLNVPGGPTSCPEGTQKEMLRCLDSLQWCVPSSN